MKQDNPMLVYHFDFETTLLEPRQIHGMIEQSPSNEEPPEDVPADFDAFLHLKAHFAVVTHFTVNEIKR